MFLDNLSAFVRCMSDHLVITCPYCSKSFLIDPPPSLSGYRVSPEVVSLPYTRDIGRFDPAIGDNAGNWSEVGKDFFKVLDYERIGILRLKPGSIILYKVLRCLYCHCLFDIYANYTPGKTLDEIWPHLFSRKEDGKIRVNPGLVVRQRFLMENPVLLFLLLLFILFISILPRLLLSYGFYDFFRANVGNISIRLIALTAASTMILLVYRIVVIVRDDDRFNELFLLVDVDLLSYWKNYTICRFFGVNQSFLHVNQVTVLSGYPSILILILIWLSSLCVEVHPWGSLVWMEIVLFSLIGFLLGGVLGSIRRSFVSLGRIPGIFYVFRRFFPVSIPSIAGSVSFVLIWSFMNVVDVVKNRGFWDNIDDVLSLCFWVPVVYIISFSTWCVINTVLYVLRGVQKIPMNADPHTEYLSLSVLEDLALNSSYGMGILFLFAITVMIFSLFLYPELHMEWIIEWIRVGLVGIYVTLAIAIGGKIRLILMIATIALYLPIEVGFGITRYPGPLVGSFPFLLEEAFFGRLKIYQYVSFTFVGIFLTMVFVFHSIATLSCFYDIRRRNRDFWLDFYDKLILDVERKLKAPRSGFDVDRGALIQELKNLLDMRKYVADSSISPVRSIYQRVTAVFVLLLTTFAPTLFEIAVVQVLNLPNR
ncbi:hypothetical protein Rcas_0360 [Roseiflexus castenholzii DSM 13941]|uniref:Uncharacterized protein n=2 Tax=Roseiflexus castenholzii TaxID=120962 RepID=A7NGA5_ROSCS|nr:hypothetical protein Rcas_0360 [Roseiflexus castenholzii DSM 13941]